MTTEPGTPHTTHNSSTTRRTVQLTAQALKHHLQDSPFVDWVHLHGKRWLQSHPEALRSIYGNQDTHYYWLERVPSCTPSTAHYETADQQQSTTTRDCPTHSPYGGCGGGGGGGGDGHKPAAPIRTTFNAFYEHILNACHFKGIPPPARINHSVFSASPAQIDQQHNTYAIVESVELCVPIEGDLLTPHSTIRVRPSLLLSRPLATALFDGVDMPSACAGKPFCRWVPVLLTTTGKSGMVTHTTRTTKYDAMQFQVCQRALACWQSPNATVEHGIGGVVLNAKSLQNSRFYVTTPPPTMVLSAVGTLCRQPEPWVGALRWAVRVRSEGSQWDPVSNRELLELCTPASTAGLATEWEPFVQWLRRKRDDMCQVYKVSVAQRTQAWQLGARTYHDLWDRRDEWQKRLKLHPLSLAVIWANHRDNTAPIPPTLSHTLSLMQPGHRQLIERTKQRPYFVVDFETIRSEWIFMVATVYHDPVQNKTEVFTERMEALTYLDQVQMLHRWVEGMQKRCAAVVRPQGPVVPSSEPRSAGGESPAPEQPPIFHWSAAEPNFLVTLFRKHARIRKLLQQKHPETAHALQTPGALRWSDLCEVFLQTPITVPGSFDFQLKHVVRALVSNGVLPPTHVWAEDGVADGRTAMIMAEKAYKECTASVFDAIQVYNEADTLVLHGIVGCF